MKWETLLLTGDHLEAEMIAAAAKIATAFHGARPNLIIFFASGFRREGMETINLMVQTLLKPEHCIGCRGGGLLGQGQEKENWKGISITAALLPNCFIKPFYMEPGSFAHEEEALQRLFRQTSISSSPLPQFILLADPITFDTETFIRALDLGFPQSAKVGGLASGGIKPGDNILFINGKTIGTGLVGVALSGNLRLDTLVSQGCRPIGPPMFVTRCRDHLILELDGQRPVEQLQHIFEELPEEDQAIFQQTLFLGLATTTTSQTHLNPGDFLIRQVVGGDPASGQLTVAARLHQHQVVQFHLQDPKVSSLDLQEKLSHYAMTLLDRPRPQGGLMFSCVGRGRQLFGHGNHDTDMLHRSLGPLPMGGFFCNGEIGPIHGKTFLHSFTSVLCLFCPEEPH